jgi:tetratricopeptide (TPR) repeat protein
MKFGFPFLLFCFIGVQSFSQKIFEVDGETRANSIEVNNAAITMISDGNYATAFKVLAQVIEQDPSFHAAYMSLYRAGSNLPEKTDTVVEKLRVGLTIFEEDDEMAYYLGNILQRANRLPEAIQAYSDAISFSKKNGEDFPLVWAYHFNRGNCYLKSNQYAMAIPDYDYALKLSPDNADVLTNRGFCYYKTNNRDFACADWRQALALGNEQTTKYLQSYCK